MGMTPVQAAKFLRENLEQHREMDRQIEAAKDVVKGHMRAKEVATYRGITMTETPYTGWDGPGLNAHLGDEASKYRVTRYRTHLNVVPSRRR